MAQVRTDLSSISNPSAPATSRYRIVCELMVYVGIHAWWRGTHPFTLRVALHLLLWDSLE